jgi:hypothetical protein
MAFHNSLQGTIKVDVLHGSSNKLTFKLDRKHVYSKSKFDIFPIQRFFKRVTY